MQPNNGFSGQNLDSVQDNHPLTPQSESPGAISSNYNPALPSSSNAGAQIESHTQNNSFSDSSSNFTQSIANHPAQSSSSNIINQTTSENVGSLPVQKADQPVPVVKVYSVRGVEYGFMTLTLWIAAASLAAGLVSMINSGASFDILAVPISLLVVCSPIFTFLFLRLKKAELLNPELRLEASKRRFSQITQFLAFITCVINMTVFVYLIIASFGGNSTDWVKATADLFVILVIAGGILMYYWFDEHRLINR